MGLATPKVCIGCTTLTCRSCVPVAPFSLFTHVPLCWAHSQLHTKCSSSHCFVARKPRNRAPSLSYLRYYWRLLSIYDSFSFSQLIPLRSHNLPRANQYLLEQTYPSVLKPQEITFSFNGRKMVQILTAMILDSLLARLTISVPFKFSVCRKVTKVTTDVL